LVRKLTHCQSCQNAFYSPCKKMFVVWTAKHIFTEGKLALQKLNSHGAYYSFAEADNVVIPLKEGEIKHIQKYYLPTQQLCGNCKMLQTSIAKRVAHDKKLGIAPIPDGDAKRYMKFLVDKKVEQQQKDAQNGQPK